MLPKWGCLGFFWSYAQLNVNINIILFVNFSNGEVPILNIHFHILELTNNRILIILSSLADFLQFLCYVNVCFRHIYTS